MPETTKKDFQLFKDEVEKWLNYFGLYNYSYIFKHEDIEGTLAQVSYTLIGRTAVFYLAKDWDEEEYSIEMIKQSAFHEVMELLLGRLTILARERDTTVEELDEETHNVIRIFENTMFKRQL